MQFIDLAAQKERIKDKIDANIQAVLAHGKYIMGPEVALLEKRLAEYVGVNHAIACASGTDALLMALMAQNVGPGDAVFTTPFTFIATAEAISLLGAIPVFVDIDPKTFNIDPDQLSQAIEVVKTNNSSIYPLPITPNLLPLTSKGIIAVDLFGLPADYNSINRIAEKHDLFVIEDAAQSFGAQSNGKKAGNLADIACTSFFPAKPLGCYGDGGMCFTNDDDLAAVMQSLRVHGKGSHKYDNVRIGINGRLDTIQAAILLAKFDIFPEEIDLRNQAAQRYTDLFSPLTHNTSPITLPNVLTGHKSAWAQYSILAQNEDHRAGLQQALKENDIPTAIYYPRPLHLQTAFNYLGYQEDNFPVSEDFSRRIFSLPMHPYLTINEQEKIAEAIFNC